MSWRETIDAATALDVSAAQRARATGMMHEVLGELMAGLDAVRDRAAIGYELPASLVERFTAQRDRMIDEDPAAAELALAVLLALAEYVEERLRASIGPVGRQLSRLVFCASGSIPGAARAGPVHPAAWALPPGRTRADPVLR